MADIDRQEELESFIKIFNRNVEKKYALDKRPSDDISEAEIKLRASFRKYNNVSENITLLKASGYNELEIPATLAAKVAEAYANVQLRAETSIDISDCLSKEKLSEGAETKLQNQNIALFKIYKKNFK